MVTFKITPYDNIDFENGRVVNEALNRELIIKDPDEMVSIIDLLNDDKPSCCCAWEVSVPDHLLLIGGNQFRVLEMLGRKRPDAATVVLPK